MPEQTGWKVEPIFALPQGFELREECDHFAYLYYKGKSVAVFNAAMTSASTIEKACFDYMGRRGMY